MFKSKKVAVIISITSDIGMALAKHYARDGYAIVGTYRSKKMVGELDGIKDCRLCFCDIGNITSIAKFIKWYKRLKLAWDLLVFCPCNPLPLKAFFKSDFNEWSDSIHINAIEQLRLLHDMHPLRRKTRMADIVFFAGGGVNNAVINFSAYTVSKIMLIKMCEYIDAETPDVNIFIVGPGWTRTKTHELVLKNTGNDDERKQKILAFLNSGGGTSMDDIYNSIEWLCRQGKEVASGRNFSIVNDALYPPSNKILAKELKKDPGMYKMRRCRNDFLIK